jgi:hypothetical protein
VVESGDPLHPQATDAEADYLCAAAGRYLKQAPRPQEAVWRYAGVRPLYDDGSGDPSAITRDYTLRLDGDGADQGAGAVGVRRQAHHLPAPGRAGGGSPRGRAGRCAPGLDRNLDLPGGAMPAGGLADYVARDIAPRYPWLPAAQRDALARRHGSELPEVLGDARGAGRIWARISAAACTSANWNGCWPANGRTRPKTCSGGAASAACT